jgi:hypothetical protein
VGPYPSVVPGGQLVLAEKAQECLFPLGGIPEGPVLRPHRARQAVQILVLFEPVPQLWRFGFRLFPLPPAATPLISGPGPTGH